MSLFLGQTSAGEVKNFEWVGSDDLTVPQTPPIDFQLFTQGLVAQEEAGTISYKIVGSYVPWATWCTPPTFISGNPSYEVQLLQFAGWPVAFDYDSNAWFACDDQSFLQFSKQGSPPVGAASGMRLNVRSTGSQALVFTKDFTIRYDDNP